jgi:Zonula occludens toxin
MSIWLFSGINGSGKTLNAIRTVLTDPKFAIRDDSGREVARRPVYQFGIQDCTLPWVELDVDGVRRWADLPVGSVVFVDECWRVFPSRSGSQHPPDYVSELAEHRKRGLDFVLISQRGIGQVDAFLRGLVERHFHLERLYGTNQVRVLSWEKCCDNVNDYHARREAAHETWKLDSRYFGAYKSAELHTIRRRLPWRKLALVAAVPVLLVVAAVVAYRTITNFGGGVSVASLSPAESGAVVSAGLPGSVSADDWFQAQKPRVERLPWTAPQYDEVMEVKSAPTPVGCILAVQSGRCQCGSWQGTPVDVPPELCREIALHGWFDHTLERPKRVEQRWSDPAHDKSGPPVEDSDGPFAHFIPSDDSGDSGSAGSDGYEPASGWGFDDRRGGLRAPAGPGSAERGSSGGGRLFGGNLRMP